MAARTPPKWSPTYFEEGSESYEKYGVEYFTTEAQIEVKNIQTLGLVDLTFQSLKEVLGNFTKEKVPSSYKLKKREANVAPILVGILEEIQSTPDSIKYSSTVLQVKVYKVLKLKNLFFP